MFTMCRRDISTLYRGLAFASGVVYDLSLFYLQSFSQMLKGSEKYQKKIKDKALVNIEISRIKSIQALELLEEEKVPLGLRRLGVRVPHGAPIEPCDCNNHRV